jgi:hypothetical protein
VHRRRARARVERDDRVAAGFRFRRVRAARPLPRAAQQRYDGRFTFVRVNYETASGGYWYRGWPAWAHGYPVAEQNLVGVNYIIYGVTH